MGTFIHCDQARLLLLQLLLLRPLYSGQTCMHNNAVNFHMHAFQARPNLIKVAMHGYKIH